jgi:hypothetical protein
MAGVALAALATALVCPPARAQWSVEAGVERFDWREDTAPIEVHEHGPRFLAAVGWMQPKQEGPLFAWRGELYGGTVTYDGALLLDPSRPATGNTTYLGTTQAAQARWRWPEAVDAVAGIEYEGWERGLSSSQKETFHIVSLRLGASCCPRTSRAPSSIRAWRTRWTWNPGVARTPTCTPATESLRT